VSVWLICATCPDGFIVRWNAIRLLLRSIDTLLLASIRVEVISWLSDALVLAGRDELLGVATAATAVGVLVVVRGAAAHAEHPEETTADAECGC
jgi:hypothetical protein